MRRCRLVPRWLCVVLAVLQIVGLPSAAWADAKLEAASWRTPNHIEDHSRSLCPRTHSADCALCQFIARSAQPPYRIPLAWRALTADGPFFALEVSSPTRKASTLPPSRGPPVAI